MADPGMPVMQEDFGTGDTPPPPPPSGGINLEELDGMLAEAQLQLGNPPDGLRYQRPNVPAQPAMSAPKAAWVAYALTLASTINWIDQVREKAGVAWQYMADVREGLKVGNVTPPVDPPPVVTPPPVAQFVSPIANGGVLGRTKWLAGSRGCDVFVKRGTSILAPADCVIEEVLGGQGMSGGDELILSLPDKSWAWRYRHTAATHPVGYRAKQGEQVGVANDTSLDMLGAIPGWAQQQAGGPFPDGWQHLDLSVNRGTDQFNPQGGGGGNVDAFTWLTGLGYSGTVLARTPGPPDAQRGFTEAAAIAFLTPVGRR